MEVACLFPGLNAISRERDRCRFFNVPEVDAYLQQLRLRGYEKALNMPARELYESGNFAALAAITLAIQVGMYDRHINHGLQPDLLIGCSLGDLGRTVCSGSISFNAALGVTETFSNLVGSISDAGKTTSVRLPSKQPLSQQQIDIMEQQGLQPSILSGRHFIVGCDEKGAAILKKLALQFNWELTDSPFPYALHSRHLKSHINTVFQQYSLNLKTPCTPVFSTTQLKVMHSAEELTEDASRCFYQPVQWVKSLVSLKALGIKRYINIGPCMSLPLLLRETNLAIKMETARQ